jgi:hypothetical protein
MRINLERALKKMVKGMMQRAIILAAPVDS